MAPSGPSCSRKQCPLQGTKPPSGSRRPARECAFGRGAGFRRRQRRPTQRNLLLPRATLTAWLSYSFNRQLLVRIASHQATETMPANACVAFYDCKECGETLKPLPGSCCVFCAYGSVPCPPIRQGVEPCCDPLPRQSSRDWLGSTRTSLMAWWIPTALIIAVCW